MIQFNNKPPKKLVVKNLKNKPKISEEYEATALARISSTIDSVFRDEALPYGHESIYRSCETLCKFHLAASVYRSLYEKCEGEARATGDLLVKECTEVIDEVEYLKKFERAWESFQSHYNLLESLFLYLDKVYINQQQQQSTQSTQAAAFIHIKRFGINFFRSYSLMNSANLGREMIEKLMKLIERIREESIQSGDLYDLCKKLVEMIRELEEYSQGELEFENVFIQRTWSFYERESQLEASKLTSSEYLKYSWKRLEYEEGIVSSLLAPITREKLIKCVKDRLILDQMAFLFPKPIGATFINFFRTEDKESMKLIYELVNGVFGIETLASQWTAFLRHHGQDLMGKGNDYRTIERIALFKEQVDEIIRECFQSDPNMQVTLKDAFESIMNGRGERSAELLALYIHHKLSLSNETAKDNGVTTAATDTFLSMALLLFRYLHCKEAFDNFYKRTLAQRLLFHGIKDLSLERQFIGKLREECGGGFVSRMESMLKDVEQSADLTKQFKSGSVSTNGIASVTGITVISGLWPNTTSSSEALIKSMPSELTRLEASFNNFYTGQRKNCSLKWNELMGNCVMRATFPSGRFNLNLSIPQALILLKFNENSLSIDKLAQDLSMNRELVEATLKSLSHPLYPVLKAVSPGIYGINAEFDCKAVGNGKVPLYALQSPFLPAEEEISGVLGGSGPESPDLAPSNILPALPPQSLTSAIQDRQSQVDSMLVRRMKHQSRSNRKDLVNYILANLGNVRVSAGDVDTRIGEMIEKEYLKLADDDDQTVIYMP